MRQTSVDFSNSTTSSIRTSSIDSIWKMIDCYPWQFSSWNVYSMSFKFWKSRLAHWTVSWRMQWMLFPSGCTSSSIHWKEFQIETFNGERGYIDVEWNSSTSYTEKFHWSYNIVTKAIVQCSLHLVAVHHSSSVFLPVENLPDDWTVQWACSAVWIQVETISRPLWKATGSEASCSEINFTIL